MSIIEVWSWSYVFIRGMRVVYNENKHNYKTCKTHAAKSACLTARPLPTPLCFGKRGSDLWFSVSSELTGCELEIGLFATKYVHTNTHTQKCKCISIVIFGKRSHFQSIQYNYQYKWRTPLHLQQVTIMADIKQSASDDENQEGYDEHGIDLGFVEKPYHKECLLRHHFPCKLGGKPAWLNPR